jgi:dihydroorotase
VAIHNLLFTDETLSTFNTNYKVLPPLRSQTDIGSLIEGLKDGTIDMVTSDHNPIDIEHKKIEFDFAKYGAIGLETAFGALQHCLTLKKTIEVLTKGKERFGVESPSINLENKANLTLFTPNGTHKFTTEHIFSTSKNSMFENFQLKGKVYGIIANNQVVLN